MTDVLPDQLPFEFDLDEDEPRERYEGPMRFVTSVSQLKMFSPSAKGCPRKWAMHYLAGFPRTRTQALIDGIRLHKSIKERWDVTEQAADEAWSSKWGQAPATRELALAMMRRVPERRRWISEPTYFLEVPELDTAIFIKPDLLFQEGCEPDYFKDWKSTSARHKRSPWVLQDPKWWPLGRLPPWPGKDEGELPHNDPYFSLENDIQFRIYSHGLMQLRGIPEIEGEWIYGSKKFKSPETPSTWNCVATARAAETRDWCETYVWPLIRNMNALRALWTEKRIDSPLLVPANPYACEYKGKFCEDLLGHCNLHKSAVPLDVFRLPVIPA